jgi:hypothetical protein
MGYIHVHDVVTIYLRQCSARVVLGDMKHYQYILYYWQALFGTT